MPCYEIRLVNIDLKMVNKDLLKEALKNLGFEYYEIVDGLVVYDSKFTKKMNLNLSTGKAEIAENDQKYLNQIKQAYSKAAIEKVAEKKKWILKKTGNRILAKKY